ncbi:MAG: hypothetical protein CMP76_15065 [Flavobacterium sp.]|uniref:hypothetical protein n=1 Tax=unclassified Flavobacterium TaxID=196869 RepID=UPI000C627C4F|nr:MULTISPECIES: hypothetical protein [unclassified Flavobacterium]MBF04602.1 hypothetical protein [Flavobacterium sp.]MCO6162901.1 hypothetical protein [Flavobacterium sp. NRK F7]|tara:strand:+ start:1273 stop:2070 length:798 start_codon:yes stop_codon:yes gene_type:complete
MDFNISEKIRKGYSLDLGKLIEDCFEIYKKTFLIAGLGFFIVAITAFVLYAFLGATLIGVSSLSDWAIQMESMQHEVGFIIGNFVITILFSTLIAPLNAGFLKLCLLAKRNQELNLGVIFEYYKSKYLKDILIGAVIIALTSMVISTVFQFIPLSIAGFFIKLIGVLIQILIGVFTILFVPLVIFANENYSEALQNSIRLVAKKPFHIILALLVATIGAFLGIIGLCIGVFFTFPIYTAMVFSIYDNIVGVEAYNVLDEIGQIEE